MVIDNASQDSSLSCSGLDTSWEVIRLDSNQGFARANNLGFELMSDMDYIVTLNPDAVASPELISQLARRSIEHPGTASFACRMMLDSQTIDGMGDTYHFTGLVWRRNHGRTYASSRKTSAETFSACAGAAMYQVEKFNRAKGFDEDFFCYCEDIDLGFRLQLAGESCLYCPEAEVIHRASSITSNYPGFAVYHGHRNLVWVFVKNLPTGLLLVFLPAHLAMTFITLTWAIIHGNGRAFLKAKLDSLKGIRGMLRKRKAIQNTRKLGELDLAKKLDYGFFR